MKKILSLATPLIISQLISMALVLTDVWMMAKLSVADLAGGGLGASVYTFVFLVAGSTVGCVANLIAIAYGQAVARPEFGHKQIRLAIKGAVILSVVLSVLLTLLFAFAPQFLVLAKQPESTIGIAMAYLDTLKWAMLPTLLLLILRGLTSNFGDAKSVMVMSLVTVLLNVPLSYWLAFSFGMGIAGLGIGTVLAASIVLIGYGIWVFKRPVYYKYAPWLHLEEYTWKLVLPLISMGLPIAIAAALEMGLIYGGTLMSGMIGVAALALHQILLQCLSFTWNINFGFSQAAAILVGKDFGNDNLTGIKATAKRSFTLVTILSAVLAVVFLVWPDAIANLFQLDEQGDSHLTQMLSSLIWVVALCFVVDAWQLLAMNLLRGMKIVIVPTIMSGIGYWVFGLPSAWYLMQHYQMAGIWGGILIGLAVTGIMLLIHLVAKLKTNMPLQQATNH
ncbi:MATE family efflux transporter [Vibrio nomapromontoriensis]|uniref:MATE family efflux transporter n=1 Tax=Vibrio nomapromontoriensis TaxID=2910246 RepID=UPI003D0D85E3